MSSRQILEAKICVLVGICLSNREPTDWQSGSNLTLINSAQIYIALTETNSFQRYYRATLLP
ncbi:MAG: hypothetical protein ACTHMT_15625 [Verrucomicrobiota bacterium]